MNRRKYGFLPSHRKSLSLDDLVGAIVIIGFILALLHTKGMSYQLLNKNAGEGQIEGNTELLQTKPDCNNDDIVCLIHKYSKKYDVNTDIAMRIAFAESSYKVDAVNYNTNGTWDKGIYQINDVHNVPDECRLDAECNIEWAMDKMSKVGTQPWYSSKHRWYD